MNEAIIYLLSYTAVILLGFLIMQFLTNGFLLTFLKVKSSRGKKVLIWIHGVSDTYFQHGYFDEDLLVFKNRSKDFTGKKPLLRVKVPRGCISRTLNVNFIQYDEETGGVINPITAFSGVSSNEPKVYDNLITRAIEAGASELKENIVIVLIVMVLIALLVVGFLVFKNQQLITTIASVSGNIV